MGGGEGLPCDATICQEIIDMNGGEGLLLFVLLLLLAAFCKTLYAFPFLAIRKGRPSLVLARYPHTPVYRIHISISSHLAVAVVKRISGSSSGSGRIFPIATWMLVLPCCERKSAPQPFAITRLPRCDTAHI